MTKVCKKKSVLLTKQMPKYFRKSVNHLIRAKTFLLMYRAAVSHGRDILMNDHFWGVLIAIISEGKAEWELDSGVSMVLLM